MRETSNIKGPYTKEQWTTMLFVKQQLEVMLNSNRDYSRFIKENKDILKNYYSKSL